MLESDVGQSSVLSVYFYDRELQNNFETEKQGRPIFDMTTFVKIQIPGRQDLMIDTLARENHKLQHPIAWARYQNEKLGRTDRPSGTPLTQWALLTPAQAKELEHFNFYTVDQVAAASDAQLEPIRMVIGMGTQPFRDKARAHLAAAKGAADVEHQNQELQKRDQAIADLQQRLEAQAREFQEQMQKLAQQVSGEAPKRGRRPKTDEPVEQTE